MASSSSVSTRWTRFSSRLVVSPGPVKLLDPTMAANGRSRSCRMGRTNFVLVEQVRLGVEEAPLVQPNLHLLGVQERDQVLDQKERLLCER